VDGCNVTVIPLCEHRRLLVEAVACGAGARVAALLESYVRRVGGSPHLPAMLPPLLSALEKAAKPSGSQALADRLQVRTPFCPSLAVHQIYRSKNVRSNRNKPINESIDQANNQSISQLVNKVSKSSRSVDQ